MSVNSKMTAIANAIRNLKSIAGRTLTLDDMASEIGAIGKLPAQTYTPTVSDQTIAAGQYLSGAQTIKGDADLVAGNIRSGVEIFGVNGTLTPGITPSGTKQITANGVHDVTEFASANVNVLPSNIRSYDVQILQVSQWATVLTLDADVEAHIHDDSFGVLGVQTDQFSYDWYTTPLFFAINKQIMQGPHPVYGVGARQTSSTGTGYQNVLYRIDDTTTDESYGGMRFRYAPTTHTLLFRSSDGGVQGGGWRIIVFW